MVALSLMRPDELFAQVRAVRAPGAIRAGVRYVWSTPVLRSTLLLVAVVGTFGMNFGVILPLLARFTFDGGAPMYGWLTSAMSLGSLVGALTAAGRVGPTRRMLVGAGAAFGVLTVVAALAPSAWLLGAVLVLVGVAIMLFLATANTTLQLATEPEMRGRVMALYGLVFLGSTPLGGPFLGWVSGRWGGRWGLALSGVVEPGRGPGGGRARGFPRVADGAGPGGGGGRRPGRRRRRRPDSRLNPVRRPSPAPPPAMPGRSS